jgi:uncharacterized membrane protein YkoI
LAQQAGATQADPPITLKAARKVALARVPGGKIQEEKLEREHGRLVYSFEIAQGTSEIQEVEVDANDGAVISGQQEDDKQDEKAGEHENAEERSSGKESGQQR